MSFSEILDTGCALVTQKKELPELGSSAEIKGFLSLFAAECNGERHESKDSRIGRGFGNRRTDTYLASLIERGIEFLAGGVCHKKTCFMGLESAFNNR